MARKNANGEGTIVKRSDGRWAAAAMLPNGKRKWLYGKTGQRSLSGSHEHEETATRALSSPERSRRWRCICEPGWRS
jgi:hypothetical protein